MSSSYETTDSLGQAMLGHAELGDRRRSTRLATTFDQMRRHPGGTLPDKLSSPADLKALYRLCACRSVTHQALVAAMRNYTLERISNHHGSVLVVHDATELDYTSLGSLASELGQIGKGTHRGYICHNVIALDARTGEVLGLLDQILHCRDEVPEGETLTELRNRETRESLLWVTGTEHLPRDTRLIDVTDQGASTFEFLEHETKSGRRFVVRNGKVRKVYGGREPDGPKEYLKEYVQSLPELGRFTMDIQAQKGRKARTRAEFAIRGGPILLLPPHAKHGHHGNDPLPLYVVYVAEVSPPPRGEKSIDWMLLTNEPVLDLDDAWRVVEWYERRWVVEEYHKAMKTGCRIEDIQFTAVERLQPAIALLSGVALTLLNLRDASRRPDASTRRAVTLFALEYVEVLSFWRYGKLRCDLTIHDFFFALARLGGHQNRKSDHRPGWLVLWRGWMKLQYMLDGYLAVKGKKCGQT
ncbi:MAG: IS4 family transposase [Planctomycetota bacterium]